MKHNHLCLQTGVAVAARENVSQAATPAIGAICAALNTQMFPIAPLKVADITGGLDDISKEFYSVKIRFRPKMANTSGWMIYPVDDITEFYCTFLVHWLSSGSVFLRKNVFSEFLPRFVVSERLEQFQCASNRNSVLLARNALGELTRLSIVDFIGATAIVACSETVSVLCRISLASFHRVFFFVVGLRGSVVGLNVVLTRLNGCLCELRQPFTRPKRVRKGFYSSGPT